jgi:hypothetical protein
MWRYLVGAVAALMLAGAGMLLFGARAERDAVLPAQPVRTAAQADDPLPAAMPEASPKTREQKRFGRYDKDRDGAITRDEYLASRRKAYARLDTDRDGRLSFDEWSAKTSAKFAAADRDRSGAMTAAEFVATAVKRTARTPAKCPPVQDAS